MTLVGEWKAIKNGATEAWLEATFTDNEAVEKTAISVKAFKFEGTSSSGVALVFAGVHGDEVTGIKVAEELIDRLKNPAARPKFTTIVIPQLIGDDRVYTEGKGILTRYVKSDPAYYRQIAASSKRKEEIGKRRLKPLQGSVEPNRNFPRAGESYADVRWRAMTRADRIELVDIYDRKFSYAVDDPSIPSQYDHYLADMMLAENRILVQLIERERPIRAASLHGNNGYKRYGDGPGIFVDPRGGFSPNTDKAWTNDGKNDDELARRMVQCALDQLPLEVLKEAKRNKELHPFAGNLLDEKMGMAGVIEKGTVHYATDAHPRGTSFGMWGSSDQLYDKDTNGNTGRLAMTVITMEIQRRKERREDMTVRGKKNNVYATLVAPMLNSLINVFLMT